MINLLKNILNNNNSTEDNNNDKNLELLCGLMIEAAYTDGQVDKTELYKIKSSLISIFGEDPEEVDLVLEKAEKNKNNSMILSQILLEDLVDYYIFLM